MKQLMQRVAMTLLIVSMSVFCHAHSGNQVNFTNSGGLLTGTNAGLTLSGSILTSVKGLNGGGLITGTLGGVTMTTGPLLVGDLQHWGVFAGGPGTTFDISGNGSNGLPNGVIFDGQFVPNLSWTMITLPNGTHNYTFAGWVVGTFYNASGNASGDSGSVVLLTINTGTSLFNGQTNLASGVTNITQVPEPGTLGLLGTGILGLAGAVRRRLNL